MAYLTVQAPNDYFFLIWTSSAPSVASVDGTGKVTGHSEGTAAITACNERGEKTSLHHHRAQKHSQPAWC
ncbi:MAG: Ig domain-containing protein [Faecalibacterium sp.]